MNKEEQMLCSHLLDLAEVCSTRNYPVGSDFLTLNEQSLFLAFSKDKLPPVSLSLTGGYELAERKIIYFEPLGAGSLFPAPISVLAAEPLNQKFAQSLSHRDYLGAVLNLGITRAKIGDIIPQESSAYLVCTDSIADFICENLTRIRQTSVRCRRTSWHDFTYTPRVKHISGSVASVRLDTIIGLAFSQSRSRLTGYIADGKVLVNGRVITSNAYSLKEGDLVSVRGLGKLRYTGTSAVTRKGRIYAEIDLFE